MASKISNMFTRARKARGWTQRELSRRSGVSNVVISFIEKGRTEWPTFPVVVRLARALGINLHKITRLVPRK